jgi:PhnB protein
MAVKIIPKGYHAITPSLIVREPAAAINFYKKIFGAKEVAKLKMADGSIAHAEIVIGDSRVMLGPESPQWGTKSPQTLGGSPVTIHVYLKNVDRVVGRAVDAGAKVLIPVADQFYGDRSGRIADPFGHIWIVSTHKEDVTPNEMKKRMAAWAKSEGRKQSQKAEE